MSLKYIFSNDLRTTSLIDSLSKAGNAIVNNKTTENDIGKGNANAFASMKAYFNLQPGTRCLSDVCEGQYMPVIENFVKKFQYPNPNGKYTKDLKDYVDLNMKIAPLREIIKVLSLMKKLEIDTYLTKEEIKYFIFYNRDVATAEKKSYLDLINKIIEYRATRKLPESIEKESDIEFSTSDRNLGEMLNILQVAEYVEFTDDRYVLTNKDTNDIVNFNEYWEPSNDITNLQKEKETYSKYMDICEEKEDKNMKASELTTNEYIADSSTDHLIKGYNKIYYGAPGCGKSKKVKDYLKNLGVTDSNQFRVTFHPEYSNFDFVGQILPTVVEEKVIDPNNSTKVETKSIVKYKFNKGPFLLALEKALQEQKDGTDKMIYLVIEEINRGNAAAIFGDLFQLLDRDSSGKSEYSITNVNIIDILKEDGFDAYISDGVYIPNNLTIIATMNTSDQNVFTMDTAFKRRWEFEQVTNDFSTSDSNYNLRVPGTSLFWREFVRIINNKITDPSRTGLSGEDKRIGKYFIKNDYLCNDQTFLYTQTKDAAGNIRESKPNQEVIDKATTFAYKILEYIWNDVAKFDEKANWFDTATHHTLEDLIAAFISEEENNPLKVFVGIEKWD